MTCTVRLLSCCACLVPSFPLFTLQHSWRVRPTRSGSQLSVAVALCFVPARTTDTQHAGGVPASEHTDSVDRHVSSCQQPVFMTFAHHLTLPYPATTPGWLFLGSHTGDSQILAAPRRLSEELTAGMPISDAALHWQVRCPISSRMCRQLLLACAAHELRVPIASMNLLQCA